MRTFLLGLAASIIFLGADSGKAGAEGKAVVGKSVVGKAVVGRPVVQDLAPGAKLQGTLMRADTRGNFLEMQTAKGLVKVPVKGKVMIQNGLNGRPVATTLAQAQNLAARRIVIVIRTRDRIIIIIIRTRS